MIDEDLQPCAEKPNVITRVDFVYDYNMLREDLFKSHAGTAHLFVFDKDSTFLFDRSLSKNDMRGPVDFTMTFDTTDLKPGKRYLLLAMAQGNHSGYEWSTVVTPGFQVPLEHQMIPGVSKLSDYRIVLDRDTDSYADLGIVNYKDAYGNNKEMMDTLWSTRPNNIQTVDIPYIEYVPRVEKYDTIYTKPDPIEIPMMRITNALKVNLVSKSFTQNTSVDDYHILISFPHGNGTIDFTGTTYPARELYYRSLRKDLKPYEPKSYGDPYPLNGEGTRADDNNDDTVYAIESTFGLSRLQVTDGSSLQIRDANTMELIASIDDFSAFLADYFDHGYDNQEFLDREYNFEVDLELNPDGGILWIQGGCAILGWARRKYFYDLE